MQELKEQKIWLLWCWEDRDGNRTKVPKSVKDGKSSGTSAKWAHTWGSYDEAVAAGKKYRAVNSQSKFHSRTSGGKQ